MVEARMKEYIWYASYGSNISTARFMCYINGGKAIGALTSEEGCKDNTPPIKSSTLQINRQQYFKKSAKRWQGKGVAFLGVEESVDTTLGQMYLITKDQFADVVKQENGIRVNQFLDLKLEEANRIGYATVTKGWYGRIMYLGEKEGYPIYTFTSPESFDDEPYKGPSREYIQMISRGIFEHYELSIQGLVDYFYIKPGVKEEFTRESLNECISIVKEEVNE